MVASARRCGGTELNASLTSRSRGSGVRVASSAAARRASLIVAAAVTATATESAIQLVIVIPAFMACLMPRQTETRDSLDRGRAIQFEGGRYERPSARGVCSTSFRANGCGGGAEAYRPPF